MSSALKPGSSDAQPVSAAQLLLPEQSPLSGPFAAVANRVRPLLPTAVVATPQSLPTGAVNNSWAVGFETYEDSGFSKTRVLDFLMQYGFSGPNLDQVPQHLEGQDANHDDCTTPIKIALTNLVTNAAGSIASLFGLKGYVIEKKLLNVFNAMTLEEKARIVSVMRKNAIDNKVMPKLLTDAYIINTLAPQLIKSALNKTIDASGAKLIFINTDQGVFLIVAHNQKKRMLLQASNGATWADESIAESSDRCFLTELNAADLPKNPIVTTALSQPLEILTRNTVGYTPQDMVKRILTDRPIFFNASATYFNPMPISTADLDNAISEINEQLEKTQGLYQQAANVFSILNVDANEQRQPSQVELLLFGQAQNEGHQLVRKFLDGGEFRSLVPDALWKKVFRPYANAPNNIEYLKKALQYGVMELSQNTHIRALSEANLDELIQEWNTALTLSKQGNPRPLNQFLGDTFGGGCDFVAGYLQQAKQCDAHGKTLGWAKFLAGLKPAYPLFVKIEP